MPRLQTIDPTTDTGPGAEMLNGPLKNKQINIFKGLAVNPGALKAFLGFSGGIKGGALSDAEHEVVALTTSQERNCHYCLAAHTQIARGAGIDEEQALRIRQGTSDDPRHRALIGFTTAILDSDGFISDDQLESFRAAGFDDAAVIEVIGQIAAMTFTNLYNHVNETEVDFPVPASV
ncbi:MAG: carboxymuconolactone decarboxylase family protein [Phycisphaerales bacterium]|nr:MAG: carboxymuconolactone decarboxylase family protein [Phycisphaerales bacterium]